MRGMSSHIRPLAGNPHFSLASLAQITFWTALACFLFREMGLQALLFAPLFLILLTLLLYERNTRPLMLFITIAWRAAWLGAAVGVGYWVWPA